MSLRSLRVSAVAALTCLPAAAVLAQGKFEGVVTVRMGSMADASYSIKGDHFRMDMSTGGMAMYMLHDGSNNSMLMVMPAQQMYMEAPQMMAGMRGRGRANAAAPAVTMTGKKETIAGYECEHMLITADDGGQYDVCGAKGMGTFAMMTNPMGGRGGAGSADSWQRGLAKDVFPLKVQKVGGDVMLEVLKIEKKSLDEALFKVPDGFQKMDMGGMRGRPPRTE